MTGDIAQCRIHEFLPHEQMELADHYGLWVTMHLSRFHGCADEWNLDDLTEYTTRRYPRDQVVAGPLRPQLHLLAHPPGGGEVEGSAQHPLRHLGGDRRAPLHHPSDQGGPEADLLGLGRCRRRVLSRSLRGAGGRSWQHYDADDGNLKFPHCDGRPVLSVYEQLLSLRDAAEIAQLSESDIEGIFWRNAAAALGVPEDEGASNGS